MTKTRINSRNSGNGWERDVAKQYLLPWTGVEWTRTPLSGGWNKKHAPNDLMPKEPKPWALGIECKNYNDLGLHKIFNKPMNYHMVDGWMEQLLEDEEIFGRKGLKLGFFKEKRSATYLAIFNKDYKKYLEKALNRKDNQFTVGGHLMLTRYHFCTGTWILMPAHYLFAYDFEVVKQKITYDTNT